MIKEKDSSGEIISPDTPGINPLFQRHVVAYDFCLPYIKGQKALEIGFGEGYGAGSLSKDALAYDAVDVTDEWLNHAREKYGSEKLSFNLYDGNRLPCDDDSIDVVVSMQVIEHVKDYFSYLKDIRRVIKPSGLAILGTPNKKMMISGINPYHYKEFALGELQYDLEKVFGAVDIYGIFGSERYMLLKEEEQRLAKKILMLDPFELRRLVPRPLIRWFYALAFKFVNMKTEEKQGEKGGDITVADFFFSRDNLENALDFICVCKP